MNKYLISAVIILVLIVAGFFVLNPYISERRENFGIEDTTPQLDGFNNIDEEEGVVEEDFEGEADPSRMSLTMKTWNLEKGVYGSFEFLPPASKKFTITFKNDGTFSATTDCNHMGGKYSTSGNTITFEETYMTAMYCEGSRETEFANLIEDTFKYSFNSNGELIFELRTGKGSATFK